MRTQALNGFVCGASVLSVQRSNFMPDLLPTKQHTTEVTALPSSTSYAVLSDPVVAIQVRYAAHFYCLRRSIAVLLECFASDFQTVDTGTPGWSEPYLTRMGTVPVFINGVKNGMCLSTFASLSLQVRAGRTIGEKPSRVVQLLNTIYPEDIVRNSC